MRTPLDSLIDGAGIEPAFQPIVDLDSGETVAYEALSRGPRGHVLERPDAMFAAAREAGRTAELDCLCASSALETARGAGLRAPMTLFLNAEAEALTTAGLRMRDRFGASGPDIQMVVEITERELTLDPAELLPVVEGLRERGLGIAIDDVGVNRGSLALMPLLRPDVIKLDLSIVQQPPRGSVAEIHSAVCAQAERTGATIVAEGIETEQHLARARAMGATLGQGYLLGRPDRLPTMHRTPRHPVALSRPPAQEPAATPFAAIGGRRPLRQGSKALLVAISRDLESEAARLGANATVLAAFQRDGHFSAASRTLYARLAADAAFVAALGTDIGPIPEPGVRGANLESDDPLVNEWAVVVLAPHFSAALAARDLGRPHQTEGEREFEFALTHDRELVIEAARSMMSRVRPLRTPWGRAPRFTPTSPADVPLAA